MSCKTITNNHPRPILSGWDIPAKLFAQGGEFDYTTWRKWRGFAYKGEFYDLGDATKYHGEGWDVVWGQTAFSAVVARYTEDGNSVVSGLILC